MTISKLTILEMLEKQSEDLEDFFVGNGDKRLEAEFRELLAPSRLLISWLNEEFNKGIK